MVFVVYRAIAGLIVVPVNEVGVGVEVTISVVTMEPVMVMPVCY
jgi:hypothetical protein